MKAVYWPLCPARFKRKEEVGERNVYLKIPKVWRCCDQRMPQLVLSCSLCHVLNSDEWW